MSHSEKPDTDNSAEELVDDPVEHESVDDVVADKAVVEDQNPEDEKDKLQDQVAESEQGPTMEDLLNQLEQANEQVATFRDQALRAQAEMQNVRMRVQRDVENAHKYGLEKFLINLLPLTDSLELAIESANQAEGGNTAIVEGIELCLKMMMDILAKENVVQIFPEGEPFDPKFHEAMSVMENPDVEPNTVLTVFQKGYTLNGRLVRPALVIVSKTSE